MNQNPASDPPDLGLSGNPPSIPPEPDGTDRSSPADHGGAEVDYSASIEKQADHRGEDSKLSATAVEDSEEGPSARQLLYAGVSAAIHATVALLIWGAWASELVPGWWTVANIAIWVLLFGYGWRNWLDTRRILTLSNLYFIIWISGTLIVRQ